MTAAALEHEPPRRVVRRCYEAPLGTFRPITFPPTYEALFAAVAWDDPADPTASRLTLSWIQGRLFAYDRTYAVALCCLAVAAVTTVVGAIGSFVVADTDPGAGGLLIVQLVGLSTTVVGVALVLATYVQNTDRPQRLIRTLLNIVDDAQLAVADEATRETESRLRRSLVRRLQRASRDFEVLITRRVGGTGGVRRFQQDLARQGGNAILELTIPVVLGGPEDLLTVRDGAVRVLLKLSAHDWTTVRDIGPERDWGDAAPPAVLLKRSAVQVNPDSVIKLALGILALAGSLTSLVVGLFFRR